MSNLSDPVTYNNKIIAQVEGITPFCNRDDRMHSISIFSFPTAGAKKRAIAAQTDTVS